MAIITVKGAVLDLDIAQYELNETNSQSRSIQSRLEDFVNVKDFGAVGDGATDDTTAIQNALDAITSKPLYFPPGDYFCTAALTPKTLLLGDGIGRTRFVFDCSGGAINGLVFSWNSETNKIFGCRDLSVACKDGNGGTAIQTEKGSYFSGPNKFVLTDVQIEDFAGPNPANFGFRTTFAWAIGVDSGDVQGLKIDNLFVYGNYNVTVADGSNFASIGLQLEGTETQLFPSCNRVWINACRTGIRVGDNSFAFITNADITFSWTGVDLTTAGNFSELFFSNIAINAQNRGWDVNGVARMYVGNSFVNRSSSSLDQGQIWYGMYLQNVQKSFLMNIHAQPNIAVTPDQIGFYLLECGDTHIQFTPSDNLDFGVRIDNSSDITGDINYGALSGTIFDFINNARQINVTLNTSESFGGTFFTTDGSSDRRNVQIDLVSSNPANYSFTGATKFVEALGIVDKDLIGGTDEGWTIVCDAGDLRFKTITSGVETNAILLDRTAGVFNEIDFRTPKITINNGPSWNVGSGSPEGVVSANVGSFYSNTAGGANTSFWVKEGGGTGNTGWTAK